MQAENAPFEISLSAATIQLGLQFCDYLLPGEGCEAALERATELLDLPPNQGDIGLTEPEAEAVASIKSLKTAPAATGKPLGMAPARPMGDSLVAPGGGASGCVKEATSHVNKLPAGLVGALLAIFVGLFVVYMGRG